MLSDSEMDFNDNLTQDAQDFNAGTFLKKRP